MFIVKGGGSDVYILAFHRFPTLLFDRHITIYIKKGLDVCPSLGFPGFFTWLARDNVHCPGVGGITWTCSWGTIYITKGLGIHPTLPSIGCHLFLSGKRRQMCIAKALVSKRRKYTLASSDLRFLCLAGLGQYTFAFYSHSLSLLHALTDTQPPTYVPTDSPSHPPTLTCSVTNLSMQIHLQTQSHAKQTYPLPPLHHCYTSFSNWMRKPYCGSGNQVRNSYFATGFSPFSLLFFLLPLLPQFFLL